MLELAPVQMVPLTGTVTQQIAQTLYNISLFDQVRFSAWRKCQPGNVWWAAEQRPPDRLYRVITDNEREGEDVGMVLGVVIGYQEGRRGAPAMCMVQVLGVDNGAGSYETPIPVPTSALEDVTERARAGRLPTR